MNLGSNHPAETLVEWGAPAVLAGAAGWAAAMITGVPAAALAAFPAAYVIGLAVMRRAHVKVFDLPAATFAVVPFDEAGDELLLDDPLIEADPEGRVTRLFGEQAHAPAVLVARIADYLGDRPGQGAEAREQQGQPADASAALHAALANIRASLR